MENKYFSRVLSASANLMYFFSIIFYYNAIIILSCHLIIILYYCYGLLYLICFQVESGFNLQYFLTQIHVLKPETRWTILFKIIIIYIKSTVENKDVFGLPTEIKMYNNCLILLSGLSCWDASYCKNYTGTCQ